MCRFGKGAKERNQDSPASHKDSAAKGPACEALAQDERCAYSIEDEPTGLESAQHRER